MHLMITALTTAALALLLVFLSVTTIRMRIKYEASFGDAGQHGLTSAIRAHGNLTEYAPIGIILIGLLENYGAPHLALGIVAAVFVICRALNAIGLFNPPGPPTATRSIGIVGTLLVLLGMALWLLVLVHSPLPG
ncbi:MAG: MAPEG family protein [Pseudomonadota bacterium]|uniref:MAPEG family protein n=1 Tax=Sphingomonas sp. ERG5 TaxID=1381597 RepID=UPI00054B6FA0|nr:MAPEG family protein [Sphingomonas sp. ERG5]